MKRKMVAPIIVAVLFILYLIFYGVVVIAATQFHPITMLLAIPLIFLGAGMVYVLYTRIKEIRSGEEDDLSDY